MLDIIVEYYFYVIIIGTFIAMIIKKEYQYPHFSDLGNKNTHLIFSLMFLISEEMCLIYRLNEVQNDMFQGFLVTLFAFVTLSLLILFEKYRKAKNSLDISAMIIFLGSIQIGVFIISSNLVNISIFIKIIAASLYVFIPSYVVARITNDRKSQKSN